MPDSNAKPSLLMQDWDVMPTSRSRLELEVLGHDGIVIATISDSPALDGRHEEIANAIATMPEIVRLMIDLIVADDRPRYLPEVKRLLTKMGVRP